MYDGYYIKHRKIIFYIIADNLRKTTLCVMIVVLQKNFWAQFTVFFVTQTFMVAAAGFVQVRKSRSQQAMDFFNEMKLFAVMYHIMLFTDFVPGKDMQNQIGYSCIFTIAIGTIVNMI